MERKGDRGVDGGKGRKLEAGPGLGDGMCGGDGVGGGPLVSKHVTFVLWEWRAGKKGSVAPDFSADDGWEI